MFGIGLIQEIVEGKIEKVATALVMEAINATPIGRVSSFVRSGGVSEVKKLLGPISSLRGGDLTSKLDSAFYSTLGFDHPTDRRKPQWTRGGWARSRQEWLNESWRHDWRSQPRDLKGRWIPGRLDHPVQGAPRRGSTFSVSRRGRKIRRFKSRYKAAGRKAARGIVASWGRDGS